MKKVYLRQDLNDFWYAIPVGEVKKFDNDLSSICITDELEIKLDKMTKFDEDFGDYRILVLYSFPFYVEG